MLRGQVYNSSPWQSPRQAPSSNRRLDRRIKQNLGLIDRSRNSNHSGSIRLKRTEHSGDRTNLSRDRGGQSKQISGLTSEDFNDSIRKVPRRMGSVLSLSRRRNGPASNKIQAAGSRSGKNVVQNLYMLTNNVPQYAGPNGYYQRSPNPYDDEAYSRGSRPQHQYCDRYERIGGRKEEKSPHLHHAESPRSHGAISPHQYPVAQSPRTYRYPKQSPHRYPQPSPRRYPQPSPRRYPQQSPHSHADHNRLDRSQDRYREQGSRGRRQQARSIIRSRRSRQGSRLRYQRSNESRDKHYRPVGNNMDEFRRYPEAQIQRLEEKYAENIYELNNNHQPKRERRQKDARCRDLYHIDQKSPKNNERRQVRNKGRQQVRNQYRPDGYTTRRVDNGQKYYPYDKQYRGQEWYEDEEQYGDAYREEQLYLEQDVYHQRERKGQPKRKMDKFKTNYSGKYNPYYQQEQIPSTTTAAKTQPLISQQDMISDASIPVQSAKSYKNIPKNGHYDPPIKKGLKLDRPIEKNSKRKRQREIQRSRPIQLQYPYQQSDIQDRLKKNHIQLKERAPDTMQKRTEKKEKVIDDRFEPTNLPSGSLFLPVESKRPQIRDWAEELTEKVIVHLEMLNLIADYTKDFKTMYENIQPWEVLIFLTYKKFYIERTKVVNILRSKSNGETQDGSAFESISNLSIIQNPFTLPYSKISDQQINKFRQTRECFALMIELEAENVAIRNALRGLYNRYIEKSGEHVNMLDCDNFSEEIYKFMKEQLDGISQNIQDPELVTATRLRMGKIIKTGLLIGFLNGKYIRNFSQILIHEDLIKIGKRETLREDCISKLFLSQFRSSLT